MKKPIIWLIVFAAIALGVYLLKDRIEAKARSFALSTIGAVIDPATQDILVQQRRISESLSQAQTRNTTDADAIKAQLRRLQGQNASLRAELERIGGEVTAVSTSVSKFTVAGSETVDVGEGDFTHPYEDPWIKAMIEREEGKLRFSYETTFRLEEFDVEVEMPDGTITHLFNTALISESTGDTLHIPTSRTVVERRPGSTGFHLNPQLHLRGVGGLGQAWVGLGVSAFSWGRGATIEGTRFYMLEGILTVNSEGFAVTAVPATWNLGTVIPFIKNLSVGVGWTWGESSGLVFLLGAAL